MDKNITPNQDSCVFTVSGGVQTGARYLIPDESRITVGNSLEHNIVLHNASGENWSALLENRGGSLVLTPLSGDIVLQDEALPVDQAVEVQEGVEFSAGVTAFRFTLEHKKVASTTIPNGRVETSVRNMAILAAKWGDGKHAVRHALFAFSVFCVAVGTLSAIYAVTGSVIMVNANPDQHLLSFEDALNTPKYSNVTYERARDGQSYRVVGVVNTREQRHQILQMAQAAGTTVDMEVQVNDELTEAVEDVYRVYGFNVRVEVIGKGHVKVFSASNDIAKLSLIEQTVKADVPAITRLELANNDPGTITVPVKSDPDKRVTLIAAGDNAYIMTQDQSRYFVGGMLPSGHVVKSIRDGKVMVSKNGKVETLQY